MGKLWLKIKRFWVKARLRRIVAKFSKAWEEANDRMKRAGMPRHERRQFLKELWRGNVERLSGFLGEQ